MLGELFDPKAELLIHERCRPHWSQAGAVVFITFRTHDSVPKEVIDRWEREKLDWRRRHGHPTDRHWSEILPTLDGTERTKFRKAFNRCREDFLDTCHGRCLLRRPELAKIVADSLLHFDGDRYRMGDFVVMPNHVHLLAAFATAETMTNNAIHGFISQQFAFIRRSAKKGNSGSRNRLIISSAVRNSTSTCGGTSPIIQRRPG